MEDEELEGTGSEGSGTGSEVEPSGDAEIMRGGPGSSEDEITNPPEEQVEAILEKHGEELAVAEKFKFRDQAAAEKAHREAMKKISAMGAENARMRRVMTDAKVTERAAPAPLR